METRQGKRVRDYAESDNVDESEETSSSSGI